MPPNISPPLRLTRRHKLSGDSQALAWEPICLEASALADVWMPLDPEETREAGASVLTFPSLSLGTSERRRAAGHPPAMACHDAEHPARAQTLPAILPGRSKESEGTRKMVQMLSPMPKPREGANPAAVGNLYTFDFGTGPSH